MPSESWRETHETRAHTRSRHERRIRSELKPIDKDPVPQEMVSEAELEAAWFDLQKFWLKTMPGYREILKARISQAIQDDIIIRRPCVGCGVDIEEEDLFTAGCEHCAQRKNRREKRQGMDNLGREIDPCG